VRVLLRLSWKKMGQSTGSQGGWRGGRGFMGARCWFCLGIPALPSGSPGMPDWVALLVGLLIAVVLMVFLEGDK